MESNENNKHENNNLGKHDLTEDSTNVNVMALFNESHSYKFATTATSKFPGVSNPKKAKGIDISMESSSFLEETSDKRLQTTTLYHFDAKIHSCTFIGKDLWVIEKDSRNITVLRINDDDTVIKQSSLKIHYANDMITFPHQCKVNTIVQSKTGHILAACSCITPGFHPQTNCPGLLNISTDGSISAVLATGEYLDVSADGQLVYALRGTVSDYLHGLRGDSVIIYEYGSQQWNALRSVKLSALHQHLCVRNDTMILSDDFDDTVAKFTLTNSDVINQSDGQELIVAAHGSELGQVKYPKVCAIDETGNVMVCDKGNKRLKILRSSGIWEQLLIPGENLRYLKHAVLTNDISLFAIRSSPCDMGNYAPVLMKIHL